MKGTLFVFLLHIIFIGSLPAQETAREIVKKAEDKVMGTTSVSEMTIRIVRPSWKRELKVKSWTKGKKLAVILVTAPARDKGTVFLKREREVWNWIPSIERSIKLPPSMMSQSWMGTDFTNDDLVQETSGTDDYTHNLLGDSIILGRPCHKIEMIPKSGAAIVWGKVLMWIDKKDYMELMAEFYDEDGTIVNRMVAGDVKTFSGRLLPSVMEMTPIEKPGNKTVLIYDQLEFDKPIDDGFFSTQKMKQIR